MNNQEKYHPILTQMDPSPEQALPILSRGQDIAVTAGAGTGKTRTLVARYLSLLAEGVSLRRIVAITFTKKAAREMRNRIREEVRKYLAQLDPPQHEYIFWRDVYENLDAARISTIHSLATDILRQFPAQMNLDPQFELLDDGQSARLRSQAVEAALGWAAQDEKASFLFITYGDWKLRRVINELVNNRLDIQDALNAAPDDLWGKWQGLLIQPLKEFVEHPVVQAGLDGLVSLEQGDILHQAEEAGDLFVDDFRIIVEKWKEIQLALPSGNWVEISRCLWPLRDHLKQKGRKENWAPANPRLIIKEIQPIYDDLLGSNNFDLGVDQKLAQEILPGLKAVFLYAIQWYDNAKTMLNGLDFDDLESKSLELLREFPEAKNYWQEEIQDLLVDEYQDTNDRQRELVNLLNADRDHLFIVGDGKQSIYRFRGADVAVFRQEQEIIRERGKNFHLSTSYRAHNNLLENLNTILKPVLGVESDRPFIEPFAGLLPGRTTKARIINPPYIEFHLVAGAKSDGAERTAAEAVAARLIDIIDEEQQNRNQELPPLNFGDVAILCRASSSFTAYESAFEKAGIPYLTIAGQGFYDRPEIRDMLNTLQVFADPQNDLAIAGLLRSPVIGLSDDVLLQIREFQITEKLPSLMEASGKITAIEIGDKNFC
ncbi:MAG: UvrD-helicase domain-containing protein [Anaerolineales bacterium]|nr:UvrD-helicase domain-containing protein [Anaerolineales bacterium]